MNTDEQKILDAIATLTTGRLRSSCLYRDYVGVTIASVADWASLAYLLMRLLVKRGFNQEQIAIIETYEGYACATVGTIRVVMEGV